MTDDVRKLLGGYATGTLTEAERNALFSAALEDAELFAALADEQSLKNLLDDPAARAELLRATERPSGKNVWRWLAPAGVLAVATLIGLISLRLHREPAQVMTARVESPKAVEVPQPAAAVPQPVHKPVAKKMPAPIPERAAPSAPPSRQPEAKTIAQHEETVASTAESVEVNPLPSETREQTKSKLVNDPRAAITMAMRAPAAAATRVEYSLLKRIGFGDFVPVPNDTVFNQDDVVRVKIHLAGSGNLSLMQGNRRVATESVSGTEDRVLPREGGIPVSEGSLLQLVFEPVAQSFAPGLPAATHYIRIQLKTTSQR